MERDPRKGDHFRYAKRSPGRARAPVQVRVRRAGSGLGIALVVTLVFILAAPAAVMWTVNGVAVCTDAAAQSEAVSAPDGSGGVIVAWTDEAVDVSVQVTYMTPSGTGNKTFTDTVAKYSRKTCLMADAGIKGTAAVKVTCTSTGRKIMCERAMYWNNRGAGTSTIGGCDD